MIRSLRGVVTTVGDDHLCVDVSGFGLEVLATKSVLMSAREGLEITVSAQLIVTESGMALYGFGNDDERRLFGELIQIKNIGGRMAMSLLRAYSAEEVVSAVLSEDSASLAQAQGVGAKRAERICFELRPRIERVFGKMTPLVAASPQGGLMEALGALGFSRTESAWALGEAKKTGGTDDEILRKALSVLNK